MELAKADFDVWLYHVLVWLAFYDIPVEVPRSYFEDAYYAGMGVLEVAEDLETQEEEEEEQ